MWFVRDRFYRSLQFLSVVRECVIFFSSTSDALLGCWCVGRGRVLSASSGPTPPPWVETAPRSGSAPHPVANSSRRNRRCTHDGIWPPTSHRNEPHQIKIGAWQGTTVYVGARGCVSGPGAQKTGPSAPPPQHCRPGLSFVAQSTRSGRLHARAQAGSHPRRNSVGVRACRSILQAQLQFRAAVLFSRYNPVSGDRSGRSPRRRATGSGQHASGRRTGSRTSSRNTKGDARDRAAQ